ncbi:MAG: GC-type dockerin domain-anchored protein [Planctomycetota bacterium]
MRYVVPALLVAAAVGTSVAQVTITLDPLDSDGARIKRMGWDLKGFQNLANSEAKARVLYEDTNANIVRIPMFATAHTENGSLTDADGHIGRYNNMFASLFWIKTVRPETEIFASLKLDGVDTFPEWIESNENGSIFGNTVKKPDPDAYSTLIKDYFRLLRGRGITAGLNYAPEWFGPNNETENALTADRHIDTMRLLPAKIAASIPEAEFGEYRIVGPDAFGLNGANSFASNLVSQGGLDTLDAAGSHYYYSQGDDAADWAQLGSTTGRPLWFTEVHMSNNFNQTSDPIPRTRRSMGTLMDANRAGADTFIWWAGGSSTTAVTDVMMQALINGLNGYRPVATLPSWQPKNTFLNARLQQAYRDGNGVSLWFANPGSGRQTPLDVDLESGAIKGTVNATFWSSSDETFTAGEIGTLPVVIDADGGGFSIATVPTNSIVHMTFELDRSDPLLVDTFDVGSGINEALATRQADGSTTIAYIAGDNGDGFNSAVLGGGVLNLFTSNTTDNNVKSFVTADLDADLELDLGGTMWSVSFDVSLFTNSQADPWMYFAVTVTDDVFTEPWNGGTEISTIVRANGTVDGRVNFQQIANQVHDFDVSSSLPVEIRVDERQSPALVSIDVDGQCILAREPLDIDGPSRLIRLFSQVGSALTGRDLTASVDNLRIGRAATADIAQPYGVLDLDDVDAFIEGFLTGDVVADLAAPVGVLDLDDVDVFITSFLSGCP